MNSKNKYDRIYSGNGSKDPFSNFVIIHREYKELGCWLLNREYMDRKGMHLHQRYAEMGKGPIVRHLCCDKRCVNPLHLMRGTNQENSNDELECYEFIDREWMNILKRWKETGIRGKNLRDEYRIHKEKQLMNEILNHPNCEVIRKSLRSKLLAMIAEHNFITIKGVLDE